MKQNTMKMLPESERPYEKVLESGLEGYREYKNRVRYKVISFVW